MDDTVTLKLFEERSEKALVRIKERYGTQCYRIAYNILRNTMDAEECENDTYLQAWNSIPPLIPLSLAAYLYRIARNLALKKYSYYRAAKRNADLEIAFTELEEVLPANLSLESEMENKWLLEEVERFLAEQGEKQRTVFMRRYWFGDSVRQIAEHLGLTESDVKVTLHRVRHSLKAKLAEEGYQI